MKEKKNIYKGLDIKYARSLLTDKKGIICGPLEELTVRFLARVPYEIIRYIDCKKLQKKYSNQRAGFVKEGVAGIYYVRKKAFKKWVLHNIFRILEDKNEYNKISTEYDIC